jgi:asparagine synthase (glutamine-hydrolysing)
MCGIVGVFNYSKKEKINENLLIKMRDVMIHRGPDDYGLWISPDGFTGIGHRRLSIIDISKSASQPMSNEDGSLKIIFNGEIYNHAEIRPELEKAGHKFKTDHSDTEVIIHAFEEWGIGCIDKFRGMFAFAIWDNINKEFWIARDRIGIKPLYYTIDGGRFIFASEIKAILQDPLIKREVNMEGFYNFLSFLTVPAPGTMFKNIYKLASGCYLRLSAKGDIKIQRYWDVFDHTKPLTNSSEDEIAGRILEELRAAVKYRKISDVPVGIFLSGGIDSSTNAALFSEDAVEKVKTFTIGYEGENNSHPNEFEYAQKMAEKINADHHIKILTLQDFFNFLKIIISHHDEPVADFIGFPLYSVSKLARENGVSVCQVGEGSDELFMGYPFWRTMLKLYELNKKYNINFLKKAGLAGLKIAGRKEKPYYEWLKRGTENKPIFWGGMEAFFDNSKKALLSEKYKRDFKNYTSHEAIKPIYDRFNEKAWEKTPLSWMSYMDLNLILPELLLMRVDKMSMALSLEARVPFLDHKFVELAMSIPQSIKTKNNDLKYIIKKAVRGIIPDELIDRKKQGLSVPIHEWFLRELGDFAENKLKDFSRNTEYFNNKYLNEMFLIKEKHNSDRIWYLLSFALWHEEWIG